jgi:hypothetical protein
LEEMCYRVSIGCLFIIYCSIIGFDVEVQF